MNSTALRTQRFSSCVRAASAWFSLLLLLSLLVFSGTGLRAQESPSANAMAAFPDSTVAYLEIGNPDEFVDDVLNHPLRAHLETLQPYQQLVNGPQMLPAKLFVGLLEGQLNMSWSEALRATTKHGLHVGLDGATQSILFISKAQDGATLSKVVSTVLGWVDLDSKNNGRPSPYQMLDHRGHRIARFSGFAMGRVNDWFVASTNDDVLRRAMDRLVDGATNDWRANPTWQSAWQLRDPGCDAWAWLNLEAIRRGGLAQDLFSGRTENAAAELLFGGVLEALADAPLAVGSISLNAEMLQVNLSLPHDKASRAAERAFFYAEDPPSHAAQLVSVPNMVSHAFIRRDLRGWWQSKEDLFEERVIAQLLQAESQLTTLFAGLDFGNDILGALQPGVQVVVVEQSYTAEATPELKLPAFAVVGRLREPGEIKRRLRIAFQSVIGFANIQLAMLGYPQLDLMTESREGVECTAATYVVDANSPTGLVHYNFSPALAFHDDLLILSSSRDLAWTLAQSTATAKTIGATTNAWWHVDGERLVESLRINRQMLAMQNMLEKGTDKARAEAEIDLILDALKGLQSLETRLEVDDERMSWISDVRFKP